MKSAHEWRQECAYQRGKTLTPGSLLADILADLEMVEAENAILRVRLEGYVNLTSDLQNEIDELQADLRRLEKRASQHA